MDKQSALVPNTTQVPNFIFDHLVSQLDEFPLKVLLIVIRKTLGWEADPESGMRKKQDWITYSQFKKLTGGETQAIARAVRILEELNLIEIRDSQENLLSTDERIGKRLFYRLATSLSIKEVMDNLFVKQNLSNKDTKETYTKDTIFNKLNIGDKPQLIKKDNRLKAGWQYYALETTRLLKLNEHNRSRLFGFAKDFVDPYRILNKAQEILNQETFKKLDPNQQVSYLIAAVNNSL